MQVEPDRTPCGQVTVVVAGIVMMQLVPDRVPPIPAHE